MVKVPSSLRAETEIVWQGTPSHSASIAFAIAPRVSLDSRMRLNLRTNSAETPA